MKESHVAGVTRRLADRRRLAQMGLTVTRLLAHRDKAVLGGQGLVVVTGLITVSTVAFFDPGAYVWTVVAVVSAVMSGFLASSVVLPWSRWGSRSTLAFPAAVAAAVAMMGLAGHGVGMSYTGLLVLCFAHIGLTQPAKTTILALPAGVCSWIAANDGWSAHYTPRLIIAVMVWVCLGALLAQLMGRQREMSEQLMHAANTDALTGVANRRSLNVRLSSIGVGDTIVLCDLDHFKRLNDTLGHAAGDKALADFGLALHSSLRESDFAARYGGEEFVLVLPGTPSDQTRVVLERLHRHWALLQPGITFSAGVATTRTDRGADLTLQAADLCLYEAKELGRNQDCFDPFDRKSRSSRAS